jgi:hypothetical protein
MYEIDRMQHEPPSEEEIQAYVSFSSAFIDQAESDGTLFDAITKWAPERVVAYQNAFLMFNAVTNPEAFGFEEE